MGKLSACQLYTALGAAALLLVACGSPEQPVTPTQQTMVVTTLETAVPPAPSALPSPTPSATATAVPSHTATNTPTPPPPTVTLSPTTPPSTTPTPKPTATNSPAPPVNTPLPTIASQTISNLHAAIGQEVQISGTVVGTASFSQGFKFTLDDGTGQMTLLLWHDVYDESWDAPKLNLGATVWVTGEVGEFAGELQIVPDFGGDVQVTAVGNSHAPATNIGSLGERMGQRVTITGQISRVEGTSSGAKLFITDDSGEILVFVWNTVLDRVPNNVALGTQGTRVRVTGFVQEFRSNREIVPALPYDIEVLP